MFSEAEPGVAGPSGGRSAILVATTIESNQSINCATTQGKKVRSRGCALPLLGSGVDSQAVSYELQHKPVSEQRLNFRGGSCELLLCKVTAKDKASVPNLYSSR